MSDLGSLDDVGETLGYTRRRREGAGNFLLGMLTGIALVIGVFLVIVGLAGPGAISISLFATVTPSPTITLTPTETSIPTETPPPATETPLVTATPACPPEYTMQAEEYLSTIADRCGVTVEAILAANPSITNANDIQAGSKILLPPPGTGFVPTALPSNLAAGTVIDVMVQAGDSLTSIAAQFFSTVDDIKTRNKITDTEANNVYPGTWLKVKYGIATPVPIRNSPTYGPTVSPTQTPTKASTPAPT
jgi:LysM repeat protein